MGGLGGEECSRFAFPPMLPRSESYHTTSEYPVCGTRLSVSCSSLPVHDGERFGELSALFCILYIQRSPAGGRKVARMCDQRLGRGFTVAFK